MLNALIFGKFAPFHNGHQMLITRALKENDFVYVLVSEEPGLIAFSAQIRCEWIRQSINNSRLFVIPTTVYPPGGNSPDAKRANFLHMKKHLPNGLQIHRVYCNEWYGEHISMDFGAEWVQFDANREQIPISGTMIRNNPAQYAKYLPSIVAKALLERK